jgi:fatty acid desaturase
MSRIDLKSLSAPTNGNGIMKTAIYYGFIGVFSYLLFYADHLAVIILLQAVIGLFLAHGLELQHEALHDILFKNKFSNYFFGVLFGLFHGVSYTHYQRQHLFHHRYLGTDEDEEIFDYDAKSLDNIFTFMVRALNLARIPSLFTSLFKFLSGNFPKSVTEKADKQKLIFEYTLIISCFLGAIAYTIITGDLILVKMWLIPWLVFGELFHFLIELPEHLHCRKDLDDVFKNTRTIHTKNPFLLWLVNGNNYHVEHHLYPKILIKNLKVVNKKISDKIEFSEKNYRSTYAKIFKQVISKSK